MGLIAHAGSLMNLAKHPASTVQILGAEKALFKALKTKHDTPKYGLIYHAQLVGQASTKLKGKVCVCWQQRLLWPLVWTPLGRILIRTWGSIIEPRWNPGSDS